MTKQVGTIYILKLREAYWSAGYKYKWEYADKVGFGIDVSILNYNEEIIIETKGQEYLLKREDALKFYQKLNTKENHRGVSIIVIPRELTQKI